MRGLSRTRIVLAILLVASVVFLLVSLRGGAPPESGKRAAGPGNQIPAAKDAARKLQPVAPADVDFRRYAALASSNVFSESRAKPAPPAASKKSVVPPPDWRGAATSPPPGPRKPDFSGWSYVGYVSLDGEKLGAVQNDATSTVQFLAAGDDFMGAEVESVDREAMRLKSGGSTTTLNRPRDFPVKPLDSAGAGAGSAMSGPGPAPQ